jgi:hypothetical protein
MRHSPVMVVFRVDRYWRSDWSLCTDLDFVFSAFPPHNPTITAPMIIIEVSLAYNIVLVLGARS